MRLAGVWARVQEWQASSSSSSAAAAAAAVPVVWTAQALATPQRVAQVDAELLYKEEVGSVRSLLLAALRRFSGDAAAASVGPELTLGAHVLVRALTVLRGRRTHVQQLLNLRFARVALWRRMLYALLLPVLWYAVRRVPAILSALAGDAYDGDGRPADDADSDISDISDISDAPDDTADARAAEAFGQDGRSSWAQRVLRAGAVRARALRRAVVRRSAQIVRACDAFERVMRIAIGVNGVVFLLGGRYPVVDQRVCGLPYALHQPEHSRTPSFVYLHRELAWNALSDVLISVMPLLQLDRLRSLLRRLGLLRGPRVAPDGAASAAGSEAACTHCRREPTMPTRAACGHLFCYYCVAANAHSDWLYSCPACGGSVSPFERCSTASAR